MITITNIAKKKLLELITKDNQSLFLYLKGGGCNGF
jgi:Fe-S cluster assembly iron-binding protein IscA